MLFDVMEYRNKKNTCVGCPVKGRTTCRRMNIPPAGKGKKGLLFILESPTKAENESGEYYQSNTIKYLKRLLDDTYGIDLFEDCWVIYAVGCYTTEKIKDLWVDKCSYRIQAFIQKHKPSVIFCSGKWSIRGALQHWKKDGNFNPDRWRGVVIPDRLLKTRIVPLESVKMMAVRDMEGHPVKKKLFLQDIQLGIKCSRQPFPVPEIPEHNTVKILKDEKSILKVLRKLQELTEDDMFSFDYETTGLRPYAKGHEIVTIGICCRLFRGAFPVLPCKPFHVLWKKVMQGPSKKLAHNMKFEDVWTHVYFNCPVHNWHWDAMQVCHLLDNRQSISSLKFQTYVHLGIADYSSHIEHFLKGKGGVNSHNTIKEAPLDEILLYNALDAVYEHSIALMQMEKVYASK
jgi:uracil-DNA glycosylase